MKNILSLILFLVSIQSLFSQIQIVGKITDCEKDPLPGVSVAENDENKTVSDLDGYYELTVSDTTAVLTFSAFGMLPQQIRVSDKDTINVSLKSKPEAKGQEIIVRKPVIYLYPEKEQEISLTIQYNGNLSFTYPKYDEKWTVIASPNGDLRNKKDNKKYAYLFWEGEKKYSSKERTYENGFVVHKDTIVSFLEQKLSEFGLIPKEYNDFIVFWTPYLIQNEWNFIHFRTGKGYEVISKNMVKPAPQTEFRIFMDFKKIDKPFNVNPQPIKTLKRNGFTLVEWGGAQLSDETIKIKISEEKYIER